MFVCLFKQKTAYGVRFSDWSSDVCSSDLWAAGKRASATAKTAVKRMSGRRASFAAAATGLEGTIERRKAAIPTVGASTGAETERLAASDRAASVDRKSTRLNSSH